MQFRYTSVVALLAMLAGASPAFAHAFLKKADPAAGATVAQAPKTLLLTFTEDLETQFCKVSVTDTMGMNAGNAPQAVTGHPDKLLVPLSITMPGKYTVIWHALSTDTHKTEGSFSFTVTK